MGWVGEDIPGGCRLRIHAWWSQLKKSSPLKNHPRIQPCTCCRCWGWWTLRYSCNLQCLIDIIIYYILVAVAPILHPWIHNINQFINQTTSFLRWRASKLSNSSASSWLTSLILAASDFKLMNYCSKLPKKLRVSLNDWIITWLDLPISEICPLNSPIYLICFIVSSFSRSRWFFISCLFNRSCLRSNYYCYSFWRRTILTSILFKTWVSSA